jgi:arylsulfatase A
MMRLGIIRNFLVVFFVCLFFIKTWGQGQKPNIVIILSDDLGYGSVNCYGADKSLIRTPHIDRLAEQGARFVNAHTPSSVCTPTRYGLLTGRYPWRTRLKAGVVNANDPLLIDTEQVTLADWLKERAYNTSAIGKWHLGYGIGETAKRTDFLNWSPGPLDLGFDYHFGIPNNHGDLFNVYIENNQIFGLRSDKIQPYSRGFYGGNQYRGFDAPQRVDVDVMDVLTGKAVEWIRKQSADKPFFLYFAAVAVHHPITPSEYMRGLSGCGPYGDFIQDMDRSVGQILDALEYNGLTENTIIVFTSDNGGDIPFDRPMSPEMQALNYGLKINGDLAGDKHTIYEGGTRVPFIVAWPDKIQNNTTSDDMISMLDVFATICEITDGRMPDSKEIAPDSFSFLPSLLGEQNLNGRTSMVTADANGMHAVRVDNWKYIDDTPPEGLPEQKVNNLRITFKPQLYNLADDPGEKFNLYDPNHEEVRKLSEELTRIRTVNYTR